MHLAEETFPFEPKKYQHQEIQSEKELCTVPIFYSLFKDKVEFSQVEMSQISTDLSEIKPQYRRT